MPKFKKPHTYNERKAYAEANIYHTIRVNIRGKRAPRNLPEHWDDAYRSMYTTRSWKYHRAHQWREHETE